MLLADLQAEHKVRRSKSGKSLSFRFQAVIQLPVAFMQLTVPMLQNLFKSHNTLLTGSFGELSAQHCELLVSLTQRAMVAFRIMSIIL